MDVGRLALWFAVAALAGGTAGYGFGFAEARPAINALAIVGAATVAVVASIVIGILLGLMKSLSFRALLDRLWVRTGLVWTGVAIVSGMNVGGFLGFTAGLRTAQSVSDLLSGVGLVVAVAVFAALLIGIMYRVGPRTRFRRRR